MRSSSINIVLSYSKVVAPQLPEVADAVGDAFHVVVHAAIDLGCKGTKSREKCKKKKGLFSRIYEIGCSICCAPYPKTHAFTIVINPTVALFHILT